MVVAAAAAFLGGILMVGKYGSCFELEYDVSERVGDLENVIVEC